MAQGLQIAEPEYPVLASHLQMLGALDVVKQEMPMAEHSQSSSALLTLLPLLQLLQLLQQPPHQLRQIFHWDTLELWYHLMARRD